MNSKERNDLARMKALGIHAMKMDCQSFEHAVFELSRWGIGMKRGDLATSAALISRTDPTRVSVTLAKRSYFVRLQKLAKRGSDSEMTRILTSPEEPDVLRLLIVDGESTGQSSLSLYEMKECTNAR